MRRSLLLFAVAAGLALQLVHCANDEGNLGPVDDGVDGSTTSDDAAADVVEAAPRDADGASDASDGDGCSADHWCRTKLPSADFDLLAVWSFAPDDTLAAGGSGVIHWDGSHWAVDPSPGLEGLSNLWASGPDDVWAVAQGDRRLVHGVRTAGAFAWTIDAPQDGPTRNFVYGVGRDELWIVGYREDGTSTLEHANVADGGVVTSEYVDIGIDGFSASALYAPAKNEVWITGRDADAAIVHGTKSNAPNADWVWEKSYSRAGLPYTDFPSIWGLSGNDVWVIGVAGENFHHGSGSGGGQWAAVPSNVSVSLTTVWGAATDDVWAVGYLGAVRHWNGTAWTISRTAMNGVPIFDNLSSVHASSSKDVWAVGHGIALHRSSGESR